MSDFCSKCGFDISRGNNFCSKCGTEVIKEENQIKNSSNIRYVKDGSTKNESESKIGFNRVKNYNKGKDNSKNIKKEREKDLYQRTELYRPLWDKNGIIIFKNERMAILKRVQGQIIEFIIAFDDCTNEGYRLMTTSEGTRWNASGKFEASGGETAYFYFQKMEHVR